MASDIMFNTVKSSTVSYVFMLSCSNTVNF